MQVARHSVAKHGLWIVGEAQASIYETPTAQTIRFLWAPVDAPLTVCTPATWSDRHRSTGRFPIFSEPGLFKPPALMAVFVQDGIKLVWIITLLS